MCETLKMAGLNPIVPQGGYFVCADCTHFWEVSGLKSVPGLDDGLELCKWMSKEIGIAPIPMSPFYLPHHRNELAGKIVRFAYCKDDNSLSQARERLLAYTKK